MLRLTVKTKTTHDLLLNIVLVSFNNPINVEKTLISLLNLSITNFKIVIIDSSHDKRILNLYYKYETFFNINYFFQEASGVYSAMNLAIEKADPDSYIWFLNPGDILLSHSVLSKLLIQLAKSHAEWGFAQAKNEKPQEKIIYPRSVQTLLPEQIAHGKVQISHQSIIAKKQMLVNLGKFSEKFKIASDLELILKLAKHKYCFICEIMVGIEVNGLSRMKPIRTIVETNYIVYRSGYRNFFSALYNLVKSLVTLQYGTVLSYIVLIVKKFRLHNHA